MRKNSARPNALVKYAARLVQLAFGELCTPNAVDLFRLAQSRRIHTLELRPLLADGCVFVQDDGFTVQLYDKKTEVLRLRDQQASRRLTVKQRFTFAHEIAHTLAYDTSTVPPRIRPEVLRSIEETVERGRAESLESFCQVAAGFILVPPKSLRHEKVLGPWGTIDSLEQIRRLARRYEVSPEVIIHRVANAIDNEGLRAPDVAVIMVTTTRGREQIRACLYSPTLNGLFHQPRLYTRVSTWINNTPILHNCKLLEVEEGDWTRPTTTGNLRIRKQPYAGKAPSYFLELKHTTDAP